MLFPRRNGTPTRKLVSVLSVALLTFTLVAVESALQPAKAAGSCTPGAAVKAPNGKSYPRGTCTVKLYNVDGAPGAHLISKPQRGAPVSGVLRTKQSWFACGVKNAQGGWLYTQGDTGGWGWMESSITTQSSNGITPGVLDCGAGGAAAAPAVGGGPAVAAASFNAGSGVNATAARNAQARTGKSYKYGAAGPNAFDCSGLVMVAYKEAGKTLPRSSKQMQATLAAQGKAVSQANMQPGDLIFYYSPVSHVAMYIGNGMVTEAKTPAQGVVTKKFSANSLNSIMRP